MLGWGWLLGCGSGWAAAPSGAGAARATQSLGSWAEEAGLRWGWEEPSKSLWATNRRARLRFVVDSRRAEFNGVAIWLSVPVTRRQEEAQVAAVDVEALLEPLMEPARLPGGAKIRKVCLDPGHGGRDPGNQEGKRQEKTYTLLLAREVRAMLEAAGLKVVMTRTQDKQVELPDRPRYAARQTADLLVSLHFNASANRETGQGAEVFCMTPPWTSSTNAGGEGADTGPLPGNRQNDLNVLLAYQVQKALVEGLGVQDRGVRRARFAVLRDATIPAVLVEAAFMTHPADLKRITDTAKRKELARAITDGILATKRLLERGGTTAAPKR